MENNIFTGRIPNFEFIHGQYTKFKRETKHPGWFCTFSGFVRNEIMKVNQPYPNDDEDPHYEEELKLEEEIMEIFSQREQQKRRREREENEHDSPRQRSNSDWERQLQNFRIRCPELYLQPYAGGEDYNQMEREELERYRDGQVNHRSGEISYIDYRVSDSLLQIRANYIYFTDSPIGGQPNPPSKEQLLEQQLAENEANQAKMLAQMQAANQGKAETAVINDPAFKQNPQQMRSQPQERLERMYQIRGTYYDSSLPSYQEPMQPKIHHQADIESEEVRRVEIGLNFPRNSKKGIEKVLDISIFDSKISDKRQVIELMDEESQEQMINQEPLPLVKSPFKKQQFSTGPFEHIKVVELKTRTLAKKAKRPALNLENNRLQSLLLCPNCKQGFSSYSVFLAHAQICNKDAIVSDLMSRKKKWENNKPGPKAKPKANIPNLQIKHDTQVPTLTLRRSSRIIKKIPHLLTARQRERREQTQSNSVARIIRRSQL